MKFLKLHIERLEPEMDYISAGQHVDDKVIRELIDNQVTILSVCFIG